MTNTDNPTFTDQQAQQLWADYLRQVDDLCGLLNQRQQNDIQMELRAHLLESYIQLNTGDEVCSIQAAIHRLGNPSDFIPLWVEDRLLEGTLPGSSTRNLFNLLKVNALKGIRQFVFSMLIGFGYLFSFYFFTMSVLKIFFPEHIGFYLSSSNIPFIGYVDAEGFTELLGFWLVPIGIISALALQILLNKILNRKIHKKR